MAEQEFELRTLREQELQSWFDHVDEVFSTTPRSYFENHFFNDPAVDIGGIFVAIDAQNGDIASTVRVFSRQMYLNGEKINVGGIGEVSTKVKYRGQKLASKLLIKAVEYMKQKNFMLSVLHTGKAAPLYASLGWVSIPCNYVCKSRSELQCIQLNDNYIVERISIIDNLEQMMPMYEQYASKFNGTFSRSKEYWIKWIINEEPIYYAIKIKQNGSVCGYLAFAAKNLQDNKIYVKDFFSCTDDVDQFKILQQILLKASVDIRFDHVIYPHSISQTVEPPTQQETDFGTMYKAINLKECNFLAQKELPNHLFFKIDSF